MSRNYLEAFVIALMSVAFGFFLTWPEYVALQRVETEIAEKNAEIRSRQDYYNNLKKISNELEDYQENLEKIRTAFPTGSDVPVMMSFVQAAAMQSGLIMKSIEYSGSGEGPVNTAKKAAGGKGDAGKLTLQQYTVATMLAGNYDSLKNFLAKIEHSSRLIGTDNLGITVAKEKKGADVKKSETEDKILEYSIDLFANYYQ
ncbi:MAG: type 4a pilus biogenesis protein PilO [Candidatus Pacebacteria bacterium]|jgi:Tfp pilus assembly protein PilO|nr:type 4a pilus biogenesis protein PilO [Candidatus Paceibacterota bacterium]